MSEALEDAFVIVLGQSCLLFVKMLTPMMITGNANITTCIILAFSLVNITCIISNWVSCRQKGDYTTVLSFFIDVVTLCVFFVITYVFSEYAEKMNVSLALQTVCVFYVCIHVLYIVWNTIMLTEDLKHNYAFMNTNYLNIISIFLYVVAFVFSFINLKVAVRFLIIAVIYWFYVLIRYMFELGEAQIETYVSKAEWFKLENKIIKQYLVSIKSYILLPFSKTKPDGVRHYFTKVYNGKKKDDLIFGGNNKQYYNICLPIIENDKEWNTIIDLGCGNATLYSWLKDNIIKFKKYIGVDFAVKAMKIDPDAKIIKQNAKSFEADYNESNLIIIVNTICYMSDEVLIHMIKKLTYADQILIVEPKRGLFWDAFFENVKIYYRSDKRLVKLFNDRGFKLKKKCVSYGINIFKYHHFLALSYCLLLQKDTVLE